MSGGTKEAEPLQGADRRAQPAWPGRGCVIVGGQLQQDCKAGRDSGLALREAGSRRPITSLPPSRVPLHSLLLLHLSAAPCVTLLFLH